VYRRRLRLDGFDYTGEGLYFVTACTRGRACIFGVAVDDEIVLSDLGQVAVTCVTEIPRHNPGVSLDSFVVMPNHVHVLLGLGYAAAVSLGTVVGTFKAAVARSAHARGLWQRGYHDHVIRDEEDLARIREYIATNPIRWALDPENPARGS
jgi:REP element-mobilizing transposase RayT